MTPPESTAEDVREAEMRSPFRREKCGDVDVRLEVDRETYERLVERFREARRHGYREHFAMFVYNHSRIASEAVTVDGEPVTDSVGGDR